MAVDKLVDSTQLNADLTTVANAIRTKGGTSEQLSFPTGMANAVAAIPTGITPTGNIMLTQPSETDVSSYATASVVTTLLDSPVITISGTGTVTSSVTITSEGWIPAISNSTTLQLPTNNGDVITPSDSFQNVVDAYVYMTGPIGVDPVPTETPNTITANGTYTATSGKWWTGVSVNVPNPSSGTLSITQNGTYDVTSKASADVNVPQAIPIDIDTDAGMTAVLTSANVGKAYRFTGTTGTYTNGDIYIVEES